MTAQKPTILDLVAQLEKLRKYVRAYPEELVMGKHGVLVFPDSMYDRVQDMYYYDLDPATKMAREYGYYLDKHPEGTPDYIVAVKGAIGYLANELLITQDGDCDLDNHLNLSRHGYDVRPGETDGFGWLSGRICCSDFEVYYG